MVNIAILGYGTVGSGVVEVLRTNQESIDNKAGEHINLKYVLDLREFPGDYIENILVHDYDVILKDEDVKVVVEVMGGVNPAYSFVKSALLAGKSVCTSNKELVAKHGAELLAIAAEHKAAQKLGYAERNPEADVEGYDACRKIAILSSLACGKQVDYEDIYTEGITKLTDLDFMYAKEMGLTIKLIGSAKKTGNRFSAMVSPKLISNEHPLAGVNGVMNAIFVKGNVLGDVMFYGAGAGKLPTASAVVSDVVDAVRHLGENVETKWSQEKLELIPHDEVCSNFFVRIKGSLDRLPEIEEKFGTVDTISITEGEFGFITGMMSEKAYADAAASTEGIISMIRYEK